MTFDLLKSFVLTENRLGRPFIPSESVCVYVNGMLDRRALPQVERREGKAQSPSSANATSGVGDVVDKV